MSVLATAKSTLTRADAMIFVIGDPLAEKVLIAWTFYRPLFKDSELKKGETIHDALTRLWDEISPIDLTRLAYTSGVPVTKVATIFKRLQMTNLVWPDGSIIQLAETIINRKVYSHGASFKVPSFPDKQKETDKKQGDRK